MTRIRHLSRRLLPSLCIVTVSIAMFLAQATPDLMAAVDAPFRSDRILVKPKPNRELPELANFHATQRARVLRQFDALGRIQVLQLPPGRTVNQFLDLYRKSGLVEFAEPDFLVVPALAPDDPGYVNGSQWHLHNTGQSSGVDDADIDAPEGWDTRFEAAEVIVAVVDTGVRYTHEDLAGNMWRNPAEIAGNGLDDDGNGYIDDIHGVNAPANSGNPSDSHGHGTQVAGVLGAVGNNGVGVAGAAWRIKIMVCRYLDSSGNGSISDVVECFDYARAKGAHVINASFVTSGFSSTFRTAVNNCRTAGIIVVAGAGNYASNNDTSPYYPASFDLDNVVAVAATTRTDALADYSNYGETSVDLAAPGSAIYTTGHSSDSAYVWNSGTSFSAPLVSGTLALLRTRYPGETHRQQIDRLFAAVDPLPGLVGKCATGGRLNLSGALGPSLIANFAASAQFGTAPLAVQFSDLSYGSIAGWDWDFGDGHFNADPNPSHIFEAEGNYTASLTVSGMNGQSDTVTRAVTVMGNYQMSAAAFNWVDPAGMEEVTLSGNGVSGPLALPFEFPFYGQVQTQLFAAVNGLVGFGSEGLSSSANTDLPDSNGPNGIVCPFWDDLSLSGGTVRFGVAGEAPNRQAVISWVNVRHAANPPVSFTFQALLGEGSGQITFQYLDVNNASNHRAAGGGSATVGLEHSSGMVGTRFSYNGSALLNDEQAISFHPPVPARMSVAPELSFTASGYEGGPFRPESGIYTIENVGGGTLAWMVESSENWLDLSVLSGTLPAGASASLTVSINSGAAQLAPGLNRATLFFRNRADSGDDVVREIELSVLSPPVLLAEVPGPGGQASFTLNGEPDSSYIILATTNLIHWSVISTNLSGSDGRFTFSDPDAVHYPFRFYRGLLLED